jgi:hypothetical protein
MKDRDTSWHDSMNSADELLDALMNNCRNNNNLIGENGLLKQLSRLSLEGERPARTTDHVSHSPQQDRS